MFKTVTVAVCPVPSLALSGCVSCRGNAMLTGGAIGVWGSGLLCAVAVFNRLVGAVVGGAVGAVIGAATH